MKSFWFGVALAAFVLTGIWLIGVERQITVATPSSRWVFDAYQHKIAAANKANGARVLVVAGSNAMFGIDSAQLEAYWRRPVINLAVNAGLGLPYILDVSRRVARAGDVILMPMEYALYLDDGSPNAQIIDYAIARDSDYWRRLSLIERLNFAVGMTPERWLQGLRRLPDSAVVTGVYGAHHLDARGDQTHSSAADRSLADQDAVRDAKSWRYGARAAKEEGGWALLAAYESWRYGAMAAKEKGGWALLAAYAKWAREHDVCVIAVPAVMLYDDKYDQDPQEAAFYAGVPDRIRSAGIAYVGSPRDFMYPPTWFFNTEHHLQDWARAQHTARLIALLKSDPLGYCPKTP